MEPGSEETAAITQLAAGHELSNTAIGPYRLIRQLGEGGMGVVYHAHQSHPIRRDVALKIIKPGMDSQQVIARFEGERQALALMDHPHIARVFDAGTTDGGRPYFAMELVDGVPLTRYCDAKRLTVEKRIALFIPVCQAIQHAHQKGVIHRDIKPSNLLVTEREGQPVVKVIDFGLAKALGQQMSEASMMTNVGMVVGTLEYMSPEQAALTRQDVDTRSDVYSLGAVLYELLTGVTPLTATRGEEIGYVDTLQRIREEEPAHLSARVRASSELEQVAARRGTEHVRLLKVLRGELDWIVMTTLDKDRARRYETVNALARDLERYLAGDPVEAGPISTTYRLRKFAGRHRVGLAMAGAVTLSLVAGVVVSAWMAVRASRAEAEARAIADFLRNDVLSQASARTQAGTNSNPDRDLTVRTALDRAAKRIGDRFAGQPLLEASIRETIGETYRDLGLYPEARAHLERALAVLSAQLGEGHLDTLHVATALGLTYTYDGKYAQAEPILERALDVSRREHGEGHSTTLNIMSELGLAYSNDGKFARAEPLYTAVLEHRRRLLGEEHEDTLSVRHNLAMLLYRQGKYDQAAPLQTTVVDVWRRELGEDHPSTITAVNNLALFYRELGRYSEAEALWTRLLEVIARVLGSEHPNTLRTMSNLATLYRLQGKHAQAEPLLAGALAIGRRVQGDLHPNTLQTMGIQADLYRDQGKYAESESVYRHVLDGRRRALGAEHPDTLGTQVAIGRVELLAQQYSVAETTLRDVLSRYERAFRDSRDVYMTKVLLGASLAGQKQFAEAERLMLEGHGGIESLAVQQAVRQSDLTEAVNRIVALYQEWGRQSAATEWRKRLPVPTVAGPAR
jgi:non-specific serine/threonine protein kinase/serine/threonine-protein kinase